MTNSKDAQITGLVLIFTGGIVLVSNPVFVTIHNLTHLDSGMIILPSIGAVVSGIGFFIAGIRSRK